MVATRGGVEDTRFEAKDTKKSAAKDSPSKDRHSRGQGHKRLCFPEKKGLQKKFQAISKKEKRRSSKFFFWQFPKKKRSMNCVFVCKYANYRGDALCWNSPWTIGNPLFLQQDLCSMFVLVTHVKFCSLWRHQFTVSEMEAIPAAMLFVLLVNLFFFWMRVFSLFKLWIK